LADSISGEGESGEHRLGPKKLSQYPR
jgi:hypothetical protein